MDISTRIVPWEWIHPQDKNGKFIPLIDTSYKTVLEEWETGKEYWEKGLMIDTSTKGIYGEDVWIDIPEEYEDVSYEYFYGSRPLIEEYRPDWLWEYCNCYQFYDHKKNIPISPVFENADDAAIWLKRNLEYDELCRFRNSRFTSRRWLADTIAYNAGAGAMYQCQLNNTINAKN